MFNQTSPRHQQEADMNDQPLIYINSAGERELFSELHLAKQGNAIRKIERQGAENPNFENLEALKASFQRDQAAWEAANPDKVQR